jgi:hypothetical protein
VTPRAAKEASAVRIALALAASFPPRVGRMSRGTSVESLIELTTGILEIIFVKQRRFPELTVQMKRNDAA